MPKHKNGKLDDDRVENLEWGQRPTPARVEVSPARRVKGSAVKSAKLTEEKVRELRRLSALGEPGYVLAERFGVSGPTVSLVVSRKAWKHVT
jgi:hypothetical protein